MNEQGSADEQTLEPSAPGTARRSAGGDAAYHLGEQVGRFAMLSLRRFGAVASAGIAHISAAGSPDPSKPSATQPTAADAPAPSPATARAEELVSRAEDQLGALAAEASRRLRKAAALAREEAEDMWVEAQQIRQRRHDDSNLNS